MDKDNSIGFKKKMDEKKILVLYTFHVIKPTLKFFIEKGIFQSDTCDFILIPCGVDISHLKIPDYVKIFRRGNLGFDFGAWSDALLTDNFYQKYTHFIFLNCSVSGPFVPNYHQGKWVDIFINPLNDDVRLFGTTINTISDPSKSAHVQSFVFSMERKTVEYLISRNVFTQLHYCQDIHQTIALKEVRMSREIIQAGWNLGCLMKYYQGVDWRSKESMSKVSPLGDICYENRYFGQTTHPYEVIFVKSNRNQNPTWLAMYEK